MTTSDTKSHPSIRDIQVDYTIFCAIWSKAQSKCSVSLAFRARSSCFAYGA